MRTKRELKLLKSVSFNARYHRIEETITEIEAKNLIFLKIFIKIGIICSLSSPGHVKFITFVVERKELIIFFLTYSGRDNEKLCQIL